MINLLLLGMGFDESQDFLGYFGLPPPIDIVSNKDASVKSAGQGTDVEFKFFLCLNHFGVLQVDPLPIQVVTS